MPVGRRVGKKTARKYGKRKAAYRKRRAGRSGQPEWASCSDTILSYAQPSVGYQNNVLYQINQIALDQFDRARSIARNYQEFKMTKCVLRFKPFQDTYVNPPSTTGQFASVPNLVYMIDKRGAIPANATFNTLAKMGAVPRRFDDKSLVVSWTPGVMTLANEGWSAPSSFAAATAQVLIAPWLPVNEQPGAPAATINTSTTNHAGITFGIQQDVNLAPTPPGGNYNIELTCHFQFRKPTFASASGEENVVQLVANGD